MQTPLVVELPMYIISEVTYTEPGIKGDTATNTMKPATIATGADVRVPLFIDMGETIKIDTRTGIYVERVKN
jgi:elongation factor P